MLLGPRLAVLSLVAAMTLTGANVALAKAIVAEVPLYLFLLFRFAVASAALALLVRREPGPRLSALTNTQRRSLFGMAALGMVGFTILMFEGVKRTSAADAGVITATLPAVVAVLGVVVLGQRLSILQTAAIALAVAGLATVQTAGAGTGTSSLVGNVLVGGAVLCEASFVLLGKRLAPPYRPLRLSLGANLVGLVLSVPMALTEVRGFDPFAVSPAMWLLGLWYALAASVICLWLWYRGLPHVETWLAGLATAAIPVAALATSAVYLGESIGWARLAGAALVMAGIALGALASRETRAAGLPEPAPSPPAP
jgi:drug/metabolite transporter (DMT)-like permease